MCSVNNDAVPAETDETQSHDMMPVILDTFSLASYVCCAICCIQLTA